MLESVASVGKSLLRIVFRGGSPERIRYSDRLLAGGMVGTFLAALVTQLAFFQTSLVEAGLGLFTLFSGVYLGSALLSRRVTRIRLRIGLQSLWLVLLAVLLVLIALVPLVPFLPVLQTVATAGGAILLLMGMTSVIHYVRRGSRRRAAMVAIAFITVLGVFYSTLSALLDILFS